MRTDSRTGRTHQRRRRSLSNHSIHKVLAAARQVLKEAKRRRLIDHNPLEDRECYLCSGVSPRRAMYLLGHMDPKVTMRVYQQVLDLGGAAPEQLERVLGCTVDEAFWLLSGREPRTLGRPGTYAAASPR